MWRVYGNARICSRLSIKEKMYGFSLSAWRKLPKMTTAKCSISWVISMEKNSSAPIHPMSQDGWMKASTTMQPLHSRMRKMFCWWDGVWTGSMQRRLRQKGTVDRQLWQENCHWRKWTAIWPSWLPRSDWKNSATAAIRSRITQRSAQRPLDWRFPEKEMRKSVWKTQWDRNWRFM